MIIGTQFDIDSEVRDFVNPVQMTASNGPFTFFMDSAGFLWIPRLALKDRQPVPGLYGGVLWSPALSGCMGEIKLNLPWVDRCALVTRMMELGNIGAWRVMPKTSASPVPLTPDIQTHLGDAELVDT